MPSWLSEFFFGGPTYMIAKAIWEGTFALLGVLLGTTPMAFSTAAWNLVENVLFPWSQGIGIALLNVMFLIGYIRDNTNLKENMTVESFVLAIIRIIVSNGLIIGGMQLIKTFFKLASLLTQEIYTASTPTLQMDNMDAGSGLFFALFGVIYVLVAIVCCFMILLAVYGRYLKLYILAATLPVAVATIAGGRGVQNTAFSFIKGFFGTAFEIVVIGIVLTIGSIMISSIDFFTISTGLLSYHDGMSAALQSMLTMILLAGAVKGAESFMKRYFGL